MDLLMDGLLIAATLFAGGYCWVLARRVHDLKSLDKGLGGSIVTLTRQIELARLTLEEARGASKESRQDLTALVGKAEAASRELRLLIAAAPTQPPRPAEPAWGAFTAPAASAAQPSPRRTEDAHPGPQPAPRRTETSPPAPPPKPVRAEPIPPAQVAPVRRDPAPALAKAAPPTEPRCAPSLPPRVAATMAPPAPEPRPAVASEVPKPRALMPIENPLRRVRGERTAPAVESRSEDEILEALSALAGAGGR
jgi:hypothetical protein